MRAAPPIAQSDVSPVTHRVLPLDGVRGLAALAIVFSHAILFSSISTSGVMGRVGGALTVGVPVFFALSGFVIYAPFVAARASGGSVSTRSYAIRRFMRIAPPYWAILSLLAIAFGLAGVFSDDWWRYYGFASIYSVQSSPFVDVANQPGLPPAWSLCIEVTFYAAVPIWAALIAHSSNRFTVRHEAIALVALGLGSVVLRRVILSAGSPTWVSDHNYLLYTLPTTFLWFVPGMLLALLVVGQPTRAVPQTLASGWLWAALMVVAFALLSSGLPFDLKFIVSALFGAGAIGACVLLQLAGRPVLWLQRRALLLLGAVSYSLYLLHFPVIRWWSADHQALGAIVAVAVPAVLALAWVSYRLLEGPSQNIGRRWSRR